MNKLNFRYFLCKIKRLFLGNPKPKKVFFEHVPKCGGTTVNNYLVSQYSSDKIFSIDGGNVLESIDNFRSLTKKKRYSYDLVHGHDAHKLKDYVHPKVIKFTILREPIDKIISHYYYVLRTPNHYLYNEVTTKKMSLMDYVTSNISNELRNNYVCTFLGKTPEEVEKAADKSVIDAYNVLKKDYDVVGVLENLNQTMDLIAKKACFNKKFESKKLNKTASRLKKNDVDRLTLEAIKKNNSLDISLYKLIKKDFDK